MEVYSNTSDERSFPFKLTESLPYGRKKLYLMSQIEDQQVSLGTCMFSKGVCLPARRHGGLKSLGERNPTKPKIAFLRAMSDSTYSCS